MNIFLCDDEPRMLKDLERKVKECIPEGTINGFLTGTRLIKELEKENTCDILLLDIDMPEISGMDIARWILKQEKRPLLIFVTSHDELVYDSFKYHPYGFIRKRYLEQELPKVLKDCVKEMEGAVKYITFRMDGKDIRVLLSDIQYFEADGNYLKLFTNKGEYRFRSTLNAMENTYGNQGFIRIHKGFLVNQSVVQILGDGEAHLTDGTILPIGRTYLEETKKQLMKYMR